MGTYVHSSIAYGYKLAYDDLWYAAGGVDVDYSMPDEERWAIEEAQDELDVWAYAERIEKEFGLIDLDFLGDANWDDESQDILLRIKSSGVRGDEPATPFDIGWLQFSHEEEVALRKAYFKIMNDKGEKGEPTGPLVAGWHLCWDRG